MIRQCVVDVEQASKRNKKGCPGQKIGLLEREAQNTPQSTVWADAGERCGDWDELEESRSFWDSNR